MSESHKATLDDLIVAVQETNKWLKILARPALKAGLEASLQKPEERRVYQASDGRSIREVNESAGVSYGTVVNYWSRWARAGLVQETNVKGRYERLVDLGDIGIQVEPLDAGNA
jgi:predicted Zn-dependent protease